MRVHKILQVEKELRIFRINQFVSNVIQVQTNSLTKGKNHLSYVLLAMDMLCGAPTLPAKTLTLLCAPPSTEDNVLFVNLK